MLEAPKEFDIRGSVLFLGSGFSRCAKNIRDENLPTGQELRHQLATLLGVDWQEYDLKTLADEVFSRNDLSIYQIIYELYTVKQLQKFQFDILSLPWMRIYTTNYDDAIEFAAHHDNRTLHSFSYHDEKPKKLPIGSAIHLHGVIRNLTEQNVLQQLVLNENSYVRQHFEKSPWYDDFDRDLRFCTSCFFVGYSLADYHISALLMRNPRTRDRTYFVTRETYDRIFANRIEQYGAILPIGAEGFAKLCHAHPQSAPNTSPHNIRAFKYLDPFMDKKTLSPPTAIEILNLVTYGTFNYQRCLSTLPKGDYIVPRQSACDEAVSQLKEARCLLIHSRIGNGKSIFLHILAHRLSSEGFQCFLCRPNPLLVSEDLRLLDGFNKLVLMFDSYNTAIDVIEQLSNLPQETKFVVSVRTGVQEVRLHEIQSRLPTPLRRLSLNGIKHEDVDDFRKLLNRSGIRATDLDKIINKARDFREVVVTLYDNREIKKKIGSELTPLLKDERFRKVFIASQLLKWVGQDVDGSFLRSVTHSDAYVEIAKFREVTGDIFSLDDDNVQVRSAMFSEYLIRTHLTTADIVESIFPIIVESVKRKSERRYQAILSNLMRVAILEDALRNDPVRVSALLGLFDRLRRDIDVNQEPLFWLQYSILMTNAGDLDAAERFIGTAYARANASPGFQTFQIDTYALRLLLMIEQRAVETDRVVRFEDIIEKLERVRSMIGDMSRRVHAIQVMEGIEPFVLARIDALSTQEMNTLIYHLALLMDNLERLSPDDRAITGSDQVRASVARARERILLHSTTTY